jgi:hypothetical protein
MKIAKHLDHSMGMYLHSNFDLSPSESWFNRFFKRTKYHRFIKEAKNIEGIESILVHRYSMSISYGLMFRSTDITQSLLILFYIVYGVDPSEKIAPHDIMMDEAPTMASVTFNPVNPIEA